MKPVSYTHLVRDEWARIDTTYDFTYYPHISVGWDNSPRTGHSAVAVSYTHLNQETPAVARTPVI